MVERTSIDDLYKKQKYMGDNNLLEVDGLRLLQKGESTPVIEKP